MGGVTGAVTGRHWSSDETAVFDPLPVTRAVTPLYLPPPYAGSSIPSTGGGMPEHSLTPARDPMPNFILLNRNNPRFSHD